jgi:hypothetical protein
MTLLEVTISVFVLVMIMGVLYGAYNSCAESVRIARDGGEIRQTARMILERMSVELECAVAGGGLSMVGEEAEMDGHPADRIRFYSVGGASREAGVDLVRLSYALTRDPEGGGLILARTEEGVVGPGNTMVSHSFELARKVRGFDIVYHDTEGKRFEQWNTGSGEHADMLPSFILIRLALGGTEGKPQIFTTGVHPELSEVRR